eukprot:g38489.t1
MAEELLRYFAPDLIVEDTSWKEDLEEIQGADSITNERLVGKLKGLKVDKSPGPDGLRPRVLEEMAEDLLKVLVVIFQESLEVEESKTRR